MFIDVFTLAGGIVFPPMFTVLVAGISGTGRTKAFGQPV